MRRKKLNPYQQAHVGIQIPHTIDLMQRAAQARQLQSMIGEFVATLLTNGKPLTIAVSVQRSGLLEQIENVTLSVYWQEAELDVPIFNDVTFINRCLKCGEYLRGEHKCSIPLQNQDQNGEGDPSEETLASPQPVDDGMGLVSTD